MWLKPKLVKAAEAQEPKAAKIDPHIRTLTLLARSPEIRRGLTEHFNEQRDKCRAEQKQAILSGNPHAVGFTTGATHAIEDMIAWINELAPEKE